jgi:fermentation-respiration switch protein FrsA (DUF1100 family)
MAQTAKISWWQRLWRIIRLPLFCYLGVLFVLWLLENSLVFPASGPGEWEPAPSADIKDVFLTSAGGTQIHAWWCPLTSSPSPDGKGVRSEEEALLYCHGNGGNLSHRGASILKLRDFLKVHVLIFDYPGYGKSAGRPTEQGCYQAGEAAYDWLVTEQKIDPRRIILYGGSLGGGVAVDLGSRKPHRAIVLAKTFTSCPDTAAHLYPWLPVRWLMRNRFDNLAKIKECKEPVFIGHGTADELIPYEQGRRLFEAANEPKRFYCLDGSTHNDSLPQGFFESLREFLKEHPVASH